VNQQDRDILHTRNASRRKVGDVHTSLAQWHQGIGGHGYVKLGVAKGVRFNLYSALCRLSDSIHNPQPVKATRQPKPTPPTRIGIGGTLTHERRDAHGILLPTAQQRRYVAAPSTAPSIANPYGLKRLNIGLDGKRMD
jgi:hypothetical protein